MSGANDSIILLIVEKFSTALRCACMDNTIYNFSFGVDLFVDRL